MTTLFAHGIIFHMHEMIYDGNRVRYTVKESVLARRTAICCFICGAALMALDIYFFVNMGMPVGDAVYSLMLITGIVIANYLIAVFSEMAYRNRRLYAFDQDVYLYRTLFGREIRFTRQEITGVSERFYLTGFSEISVSGRSGESFCKLENNMPGYEYFANEMEAYGFLVRSSSASSERR